MVFLLAAFAIMSDAAPGLGQQSGATKLTLGQIEGLVSHQVPDTTLHNAIMSRGIAFSPTAAILDRLRTLGAGPLVLADLSSRVPGGVQQYRPAEPVNSQSSPSPLPLNQARAVIPGILTDLFKALNDGNPRDADRFLTPELAANGLRLDAICRPFTYRAHYIEVIYQKADGNFEARVHVLYKTADEKGLILRFKPVSGTLQLFDLSDDQNEWLEPDRQAATDLVRKFLYASRAGEGSVLESLADSGIDTRPYVADPCWQGAAGKIKDVEKVVPEPDQLHGLKMKLTAVVAIDTTNWMQSEVRSEFWVERVGDDLKVVALTLMREPAFVLADDSRSAVAACHGVRDRFFARVEAPGLERRTLLRFGLPAPDPDLSVASPASLATSQSVMPAAGDTPVLEEAEARKLLVQSLAPAYPPIARAAHVSGDVVLSLFVLKSGDVKDLNVLSGPALLQQTAKDAVGQWRFRPYIVQGMPTDFKTDITIHFNLNQ
jgi:TonB family protein